MKILHSQSKESSYYSPVKFSFFLKSRLILTYSIFSACLYTNISQTLGYLTQEFLGLRTRIFQGIIFI